MKKKQQPVHWWEFGTTDMPVNAARKIYNEVNARGDNRARASALQNIVRNEGRLASKYAPQYYAQLVADREQRNAGLPRTNLMAMAKGTELENYLAAVARGE